MATRTAARAKASFPVAGPGDACNLKVATGSYTFAANPSAADIVKTCKVPAGAVVVGGHIMGADLDTGTEALDFDFGWAATDDEVADPDGFGNFGVSSGDAAVDIKPEVGIYYPLGGVLRTAGPKLFTKEATLQFTVNAPANAGGTGMLSAVVYFFMDPNFSAAN